METGSAARLVATLLAAIEKQIGEEDTIALITRQEVDLVENFTRKDEAHDKNLLEKWISV